MILIPAIDIKDKKCVRLFKGDFDKETIYSPYQNISVQHIASPINPIILQNGHLFYQTILNLLEVERPETYKFLTIYQT